MTEGQDRADQPDVVEGAARALSEPADSDLTLLSAVHLGLRTVGQDPTATLPWQRPPGSGEDVLATRRR